MKVSEENISSGGSTFVKIPGPLKLDNLNIELTMYDREKDFRDVFQMASASSRNSTGVDEKEFGTEAKVHKKLDESKVVICRDKADGSIVSAVLTCPEPNSLSRSTHSPLCGGYLIVSEKYRGSRVGYHLNRLMMHTMVQEGYRGLIGRTAVTARSVLMARVAGGVYLGVVPRSLRISKWDTVVDDIIVYYDLQHMRSQEVQKKVLEKFSGEPSVADLNVPAADVSRLNVRIPGGFQPVQGKLKTRLAVRVEEASPEDYLTIEGFIRQAALEGHGFGVDEFTDSGTFNRNLFRDKRTHAVVARTGSDGRIVGAVIFGTNSVCRTENQLMGGYIAVPTEHRGVGVGTLLANTLIDTARSLRYEGVLLDVYQSESRTIAWSTRLGFHVTGSLPHCGYVRRQGYVDSLLFCREFKFDSADLLETAKL